MPANHVYVRHLGDPDGDGGVRRLADPRPCGAPSDQSVWWPPVMLDPGWVRRHHAEFDVFHVHFGFDAQTVESLKELVGVLRAYDKPLVYTTHDLRNPHHSDRVAHDEHLDVLIPAAHRVVTLTPGAAEAITRRWGRRALVLPHPHVVGLPLLPRPRRDRNEFVIGVHLKSLRANMDCHPVLETLVGAVASLPGAVLRVDVHSDVLEASGKRHDAGLVSRLRVWEERGEVRLRVHDFFTDDQLWNYLGDDIDVSVLPYRFGTHSGWLEACHDLGTMVIAPDCGFYRQQRPCLIYRNNETSGFDPASLVSALRTAYDDRPHWRASVEGRRAERVMIARAHRRLYAQLVV